MDDYGEPITIGSNLTHEKSAGETIRLVFNWARELDGDTIEDSAFSLLDGLTSEEESFTDTTATIVISGGTWGTYRIRNTVTTNTGLVLEETYTVKVTDEQ